MKDSAGLGRGAFFLVSQPVLTCSVGLRWPSRAWSAVLPAPLHLILVFQKVKACRTNEPGSLTLCWDATSEHFPTSVKAYSQRPAVKPLGKARETGTSLRAQRQGRGWLLGSHFPPITCPALSGRGALAASVETWDAAEERARGGERWVAWPGTVAVLRGSQSGFWWSEEEREQEKGLSLQPRGSGRPYLPLMDRDGDPTGFRIREAKGRSWWKDLMGEGCCWPYTAIWAYHDGLLLDPLRLGPSGLPSLPRVAPTCCGCYSPPPSLLLVLFPSIYPSIFPPI